MSRPAEVGEGWRAWLGSDAPTSRHQARLGEIYRFGRALTRHPLALAGLAIVLLLMLVAALAPLLAPYAPSAQHLAERLQGPGARHWLGTDELGRDILSRLIYGTRITLGIVALVTAISAPLGLAIGCMAGYAGGWIDVALMRMTDVFLALPRLILALAFVAALGPGIENAVLAIALVAWPPYARIARAETVTIARSDFIASAPRMLETIQNQLFQEASAHLSANIRSDLKSWDDLAAYYGAGEDESEVKGWARVAWSKPSGDALEEVGERLKRLKLTIRNAPLQQPSSFGACVFTGKPGVEEILIARPY